ncbi:hypothetical protein GCM10010254_50780 [Streptomyces chromofuscus]|nr:hypothetical protein GCM10010254_50780 [Streptomyces chromofuscus]
MARRAVLTRGNSTARQCQAPPGKDSIPLLKRVSQVRILPGHQPEGPGPIMVQGLCQAPLWRLALGYP